jgi:nitronate monooxygenase
MTQPSVDAFLAQFRIPVIAAPMTGVSGKNLAAAAAANGIGGSFPVHNAASPAELDDWLTGFGPELGLVIPNLVVHRSNARLAEDLAVVAHHRVPAVITSVGSPEHVVGPLHDAEVLVFSDVASMRHVERAIAAGVDGLVLLTAGAGGQTGWANPFAFVRAVRRVWDGPVVLAGGITDGTSVLAALVAGFDLVYMGTPFIATTESAATQSYKDAVVAASMDDIELTGALTGLPSSMIRTATLTTGALNSPPAFSTAVLEMPDRDDTATDVHLFSAGHGVAGVHSVTSVTDLVGRIEREYRDARDSLEARFPPSVGLMNANRDLGAHDPHTRR